MECGADDHADTLALQAASLLAGRRRRRSPRCRDSGGGGAGFRVRGVLPQLASRPTATEAERSRAVNFLNFIVQFLPFVHSIHWGCSVLRLRGEGAPLPWHYG